MIAPVLGAITAYNVSVFIHVAAVVVGFGATFAESVMFPVAMRMDPRHLPYVHELQLTINRYFANPALLIIIVTGFYQVSEGNWSLGDFWISATLAIAIVVGAINGAYFIPADRRLGAMVTRELEGGGELSEEYKRRSRAEGMMGALTGVLILLAIFFMVVKPGA
jgi:uncharacterized membrane protein